MPLVVAEPEAVSWSASGLSLDSPTTLESAPAGKITDAIVASGEFSAEVWVAPANVTQDGPARILGVSGGSSSRNFTIGQGQWGPRPADTFYVRSRSTVTSENGEPALATQAGSATTELTHVVYTRQTDGTTRIYLDGVEVAVGATGGDLSNWDNAMAVLIGNETSADRPWLGTICLAAIYDNALTPAEVTQNHNATCETVDTQEAPPGLVEVESEDGVEVEIDSSGGIYPWEVEISVEEESTFTALGDELLASPIYNINVPEAPSFTAELTIPYDETQLDDFPEEDLQLITWDEEIGLWVPYVGEQVVDVEANTVSAEVTHFSRWSLARDFLPATPPSASTRCSAPTDIRVIFHMNDPLLELDPQPQTPAVRELLGRDSYRVQAIERIIESMSTDDRLSLNWVVNAGSYETSDFLAYSDPAYVQYFEPSSSPSDLSALDYARYVMDQDAIEALESVDIQSRPPSESMELVWFKTAVWSLGSNEDSIHIVVTASPVTAESEGGPSWWHLFSGELQVIGIGDGPDSDALQRTAEEQGGAYYSVPTVEDLPLAFEEIAMLLGDGTDTDGDTLTDCAEEGGVLTNLGFSNPGPNPGFDPWRVVRTDRFDDDSDGDGLNDREELGRLVRLDPNNLSHRPWIDAGVTSYYNAIADPWLSDTDGDGLRDGREAKTGWIAGGRTVFSDPLLVDTDGDLTTDYWEWIKRTNPNDFDLGETDEEIIEQFEDVIRQGIYGGDLLTTSASDLAVVDQQGAGGPTLATALPSLFPQVVRQFLSDGGNIGNVFNYFNTIHTVVQMDIRNSPEGRSGLGGEMLMECAVRRPPATTLRADLCFGTEKPNLFVAEVKPNTTFSIRAGYMQLDDYQLAGAILARSSEEEGLNTWPQFGRVQNAGLAALGLEVTWNFHTDADRDSTGLYVYSPLGEIPPLGAWKDMRDEIMVEAAIATPQTSFVLADWARDPSLQPESVLDWYGALVSLPAVEWDQDLLQELHLALVAAVAGGGAAIITWSAGSAWRPR